MSMKATLQSLVQSASPALRQSGRPSKLRRTCPDGPSPNHLSTLPLSKGAPGTETNPIMFNDDDDDEAANDTSSRENRRPDFLLLQDLLLHTLALLPPDISRERVFQMCYTWGYKVRENKEAVRQRIINCIAAIDDFPNEPSNSLALTIPEDSPHLPRRWKDNWQNFRDPEVYAHIACQSLLALFPQYCSTYIRFMFVFKGNLFSAYLALLTQTEQNGTVPDWDNGLSHMFHLDEAQKKMMTEASKSVVYNELQAATIEFKQLPSHSTGPVVQGGSKMDTQTTEALLECDCCSTEVELDQIVFCSGDSSHNFCHTCMRNYVDALVGEAKYRPVCFALGSDCRAPISDRQLRQCLVSSTLDLLLDRQFQEDAQKLGLHLEECPFCEYAEEIDADCASQIFACKKLSCQKISCRKCKREAHNPKTCEQARVGEDGKYLDPRHEMEEAMTRALMRQCNRCKTPFIKTSGCNKMTCTKCQNSQCYICGKDAKDYLHFHGKCALHDKEPIEVRHTNDVEAARIEAIAKIKQRNPLISSDELDVQVEASVLIAETRNPQKAQAAQGVRTYIPQTTERDLEMIRRQYRERLITARPLTRHDDIGIRNIQGHFGSAHPRILGPQVTTTPAPLPYPSHDSLALNAQHLNNPAPPSNPVYKHVLSGSQAVAIPGYPNLRSHNQFGAATQPANAFGLPPNLSYDFAGIVPQPSQKSAVPSNCLQNQFATDHRPAANSRLAPNPLRYPFGGSSPSVNGPAWPTNVSHAAFDVGPQHPNNAGWPQNSLYAPQITNNEAMTNPHYGSVGSGRQLPGLAPDFLYYPGYKVNRPGPQTQRE